MPTDFSFTPETLLSQPLGGKRFYYPPQIGPKIGYEPWFTDWFRSALTVDTVFLDVGAAIGYYVVLAADHVRTVVAFEPHPKARALLWENIRRNEFTNVDVIERPLFSRVTRSNLGRHRQLRISPKGQLETTTLDALNLAPTIIKIDTEGAEYDILMGGEQTLLQHAPTLLIEVHLRRLQRYGYKGRYVYQFLRGLGYRITELAKQENNRWIRAEK